VGLHGLGAAGHEVDKMVPTTRQGRAAGNGSLGGSIILPNPKKPNPPKSEKRSTYRKLDMTDS